MDAQVTAIIATLCASDRAESLPRAIDSLHAASLQPVRVLVVVNGSRVDEDLYRRLQARADVEMVRIPQGSLPAAMLAGRRAVSTPFFCFLDDDDEYLPGAIDTRLEAITREPSADVVVTNGERQRQGQRRPALRQLMDVEAAPLSALFRETWLASCSGLYRSAAVTVSYFEAGHAYVEWTWLALRIAQTGLRIRVLDVPTFIIHGDTEGSASKHPVYASRIVALLERVLATELPDPVRRDVRRRYGQALHDLSVVERDHGAMAHAWSTHLRSIKAPGGWRFAGYTVWLLLASLGVRR